MRVINRETAFEGDFLKIIRKTAMSKEGDVIVWETVERTFKLYNGGAVLIVGLTDKEEIILEKQWRAPTETYIIQLPGGLTDIEGESEEEAARREFLEETGYVAGQLIPVAFVPAFPVLTSMRDRYFFAPRVEYRGSENKDIAEDIEIIPVRRNNLYSFFTGLPSGTELDLRVPGAVWMLEKQGLL